MTSHAFLLDFIVREGDNLAQFFFTIITGSLSLTIVPRLLELTITVFEISVITWLPFRFYCARWGQFGPIFFYYYYRFIIPYNSTKAFGANCNCFRDKRYHMATFSILLSAKGTIYPNFSFTFLSY